MQKVDKLLGKTKVKLFFYSALVIIGTVIFCYRGAVFSFSALYAEDGIYLGRIINDGFLKSCFSTRSGGSGDFFNVGSYCLLEVSFLINKLVWKNDLTNFPVIMGVVSSIFYSLVAMFEFCILSRKSKVVALAGYLGVVLMPVGTSGMEIYGRILNTVFIFPLLAIFIEIERWRIQNEKKTIKSNVLSIAILICGLSFPVAFGVLGVFVGVRFVNDFIKKNIFFFLKNNIFEIISLIIAILILPIMIGSKGATAGMTPNNNATIEYLIARCFIFAFVSPFYTKLNNVLTIAIFIITLFPIIIAILRKTKNAKSVFNDTSSVVTSTFLCILVSAYMRYPLTSFFTNYTSSYPDRYFYGCNLMFLFCFMFAIAEIFENFIIKNDFIKKSIVYIVLAYVSICCILNNKLKVDIELDSKLITGDSQDEIFDWPSGLKNAEKLKESDMYRVYIMPMIDRKLYIDLPEKYIKQ